jgi:hypothetical protein
VDVLRGEYARPTVLADGAATAERVLAALDGAWLAHVAAHGHFRADSTLLLGRRRSRRDGLTADEIPFTRRRRSG